MLKKYLNFILLFFVVQVSAKSVVTYELSGKIFDAETKQALSGVLLSIGDKMCYSNHQGRYNFKNLKNGNHQLKVKYYSNYSELKTDVSLWSDTILNLELHKKDLLIDEVVVTGTRTPKLLAETPVLTSLIKSKTISESVATNSLEVLQDNIPGLVTTPNPMGNNLKIRGLSSRYILFLVDGERLVSEGAGGNINFDQLDVNNIEQIEVVNGALSTLYGSNAVGGVINIITKKPKHKIETGIDVTTETNNTWRTRASFASRLKSLTTNVGVFRNSSDGFGSDGNGSYASKYEDYGANLKLGYDLNKNLKLDLIGRYFQHETFNIPGSMNVSHPFSRKLTTGLNLNHLTNNKKSNTKLSIHWEKYFDSKVLENQQDKVKTENTVSYVSSKLINQYSFNEQFNLVSGIDYLLNMNYAQKLFGSQAMSKDVYSISGFSQLDWQPLSDLNVVGGVRYTYNSQFNSSFNPQLSAMYKLGAFRLRANVGSSFRAPTIKELYYDFDHNGMFWIYGNANLKAEKGLLTTLSLEYTHGMFNSSISAYYNKINNKITQTDKIANGRNEKHYKNVSSVDLKGVDFNLSYRFLHDFLISGTYSFCSAIDNSTGLQLENNVRHSATLRALWTGEVFNSPMSVQFSGRVHSPIQIYAEDTNDQGESLVSAIESKNYSLWKVSINKPFKIYNHEFTASFKCDNLFNFKDVSYVNSGRTYLFGIKYTFKK